MQNSKPKLEIIYYTDPYCTWCWGSEPIIRHIQEVYSSQIKITYKMGGLVEDMAKFYDSYNDISQIEQVAPHWLEASKRHGMPVDIRVFDEIKSDFKSTYPANIAYKAAQLQGKVLADKYLRRLREAAAYERKPIHRLETLKALAAEISLDAKRFEQDFNGKAKQDFLADINDARSRGIYGFPTFLIKNKEGDETLIKGYRTFDIFVGVFNQLSKEPLKKKKPIDILAFVNKYQRVATREVAETLGLTDEEAQKRLEELASKGLTKKIKAGNNFVWQKA